METQIAVAVLLAGVYYLLVGDATRLGIALGIGLLTRPDYALWVGPALLALFLTARRDALKSAVITLLVILPWLIFTTAYYGSPVPHTIAAKQQSYTQHPPIGRTPESVVDFVEAQLHQHHDQWRYLAPFREHFAVSSGPLDQVWLLFIALGVIGLALLGAWKTRRVTRWWAAIAYVSLFAIYKMLLLPPTYYEWYLPPFMAIVVLLVGAGLTRVQLSVPRLGPAFAGVFAILLVWQIAAMILIDRRAQDIENHVRTPVGQYLRTVVKPGEAVTSESAGYVGYYSFAKLYDYPGLTSPTAFEALKRAGPTQNSLVGLINALRPRWIVLRPFERNQLREHYPAANALYRPAKVFSYRPNATTAAGDGVLIKRLGGHLLQRRHAVRRAAAHRLTVTMSSGRPTAVRERG